MNSRLVAGAALLAWAANARAFTATVRAARVPLWPRARAAGRPLGLLEAGTSVEVLAKNRDESFLKVEVARAQGGRARGYVATPYLAAVEPAAEASRANEAWVPDRRWSLGAGFSGYSTPSGSSVTVSGDARYLWFTWLESIAGVDLTFAKATAFGVRGAQRVYAPIGAFRPYGHVGYRLFNVTDPGDAALELGGGFQVLYGQGSSYFEVGVVYLDRTLFNARAQNGFLFGGSSGFRF